MLKQIVFCAVVDGYSHLRDQTVNFILPTTTQLVVAEEDQDLSQPQKYEDILKIIFTFSSKNSMVKCSSIPLQSSQLAPNA